MLNAQQTSRQHRHVAEWPHSTNDANQKCAAQTADSLAFDVSYFVDKSTDLTAECDKAIGTIMEQVLYEASRRGLDNAVRLEKPTQAAAFFLPLTSTCGLDGMQSEEFGSGHLSIWASFITTLVVLGLSTVWY